MIHVLHGAVLWSIWTIACTRLYTRYVVVDISLATPFNNPFICIDCGCDLSETVSDQISLRQLGSCLRGLTVPPYRQTYAHAFEQLGDGLTQLQIMWMCYSTTRSPAFLTSSSSALSLFFLLLFFPFFFFWNFLFFGHAISACEKKDGSQPRKATLGMSESAITIRLSSSWRRCGRTHVRKNAHFIKLLGLQVLITTIPPASHAPQEKTKRASARARARKHHSTCLCVLMRWQPCPCRSFCVYADMYADVPFEHAERLSI